MRLQYGILILFSLSFLLWNAILFLDRMPLEWGQEGHRLQASIGAPEVSSGRL